MSASTALLIEPHYAPNCDFLALLLSHQEIYFSLNDPFCKATYRNRCHIAAANGLQVLSIPLEGGRNQRCRYCDVRISYESPWQKQQWQALRSAYGSSPFFMHYDTRIQPFYEKRFTFLTDFNIELLNTLCQAMKLPLRWQLWQNETPAAAALADYRNRIVPRGGDDNLTQLPLQTIAYPQVFSYKRPFEPHLSSYDLLFNVGNRSADVLQKMQAGNWI